MPTNFVSQVLPYPKLTSTFQITKTVGSVAQKWNKETKILTDPHLAK